MPDTDRRRRALDLIPPALVAAGALLMLAPIFVRELRAPDWPPHFQYQADAFLHGRLDVGAGLYDVIVHRSKFYLPFGPLPSVLMMPFVALLGKAAPLGLLTLPATAGAAIVLWRLFEALAQAPRERAWLVLASLAGTVYLSCVPLNSSYFTAHVVAFLCLGGALLLAAQGRAPLGAGLLVGLAGLTRSPEFVAALPIAWLYWDRSWLPAPGAGDTRAGMPGGGDARAGMPGGGGARAGMPGLAAGRVPRGSGAAPALVLAGVIPAVVVTLAFNAARFGSPLESGYSLQALSEPALVEARNRGLFSLLHLPKNLYYLLLASPLPHGGTGAAVLTFPFVQPSPWGMGIIFVSPWLLALAWARGRGALLLGAATVLLLLPSLLYYGIGWVQFGYRYGLDATPFAVALAALAYRRPGWREALPWLAIASVAVNVWGAYWLSGLLP